MILVLYGLIVRLNSLDFSTNEFISFSVCDSDSLLLRIDRPHVQILLGSAEFGDGLTDDATCTLSMKTKKNKRQLRVLHSLHCECFHRMVLYLVKKCENVDEKIHL